MRTRITVLAAFVVSALLVTSVALADEGDVVIEGTGKLVAAGIGNVELQGAGYVRLAMSGDVTITDFAGDAEIKIRSAGDEKASDSAAESTTISLINFTGVVTVEGSDFSISASGKFRRLTAKGTGTVFLQGRGWYRTSGGRYGFWTPGGVRLTYEPAG